MDKQGRRKVLRSGEALNRSVTIKRMMSMRTLTIMHNRFFFIVNTWIKLMLK